MTGILGDHLPLDPTAGFIEWIWVVVQQWWSDTATAEGFRGPSINRTTSYSAKYLIRPASPV
ncbi:MAG: hypothetical protein ACRENP_05025 [Longimicrobiales bacterium]